MQKTLTFIVGDGEVELEASGFKGGACEAASKAFEQVLGAEIKSKKRKAEYHQADTSATKLTVGK